MLSLGISGVFLSTLVTVWVLSKLLPLVGRIRKWHTVLDGRFPQLPTHWLWGHVPQMMPLRGFCDKHLQFIKEGAKSYLFWVGFFRPVITVAHPETVKAILKTAEPKSKAGGGYEFLVPWLGDGLLISSGRKWERNRRLLTPAFHFDILKPYIKIYNQSTEGFMKNLEKESKGGNSVEVFGPAGLSTLDTMLQCALSYTDDIQEKGTSHPYVRAVNQISTLIVKRAMVIYYYVSWIYNLSPGAREFARIVDYVHEFSEKIIESRKKALESDPDLLKKRHLDFLDILLTARDESGQGLTDREIRDEVDTFMFEGHDTTSSAISWCLYCLAKYPDVQNKVLKEVSHVMDNRQEVEWEDLTKLQYTSMFIKESMRLYPPVPIISRQLSQPMEIDGVRLPKDVMVDISMYLTQRNPNIWDNPLEFKPERFDPDLSAGRDPYSFVPFSAGPRNCIGQNFALNEIKVMVSRVVRRFEIGLDQKRLPVPKIEVVLRSENGMNLKFKRRK